MFYVYFLKSKKFTEQTYVGYTSDLKKRIREHNTDMVQSTKRYKPWELIFYEAYKSKSDAKRREMYLKTTKGRKSLKLIVRDSLSNS